MFLFWRLKFLSSSLLGLSLAWSSPSFAGTSSEEETIASLHPLISPALKNDQTLESTNKPNGETPYQGREAVKNAEEREQATEVIGLSTSLTSSRSATEILCDELWLKVFQHLSPTDLLTIMPVSKDFQRLANDNNIWNGFLCRLNFTVPNVPKAEEDMTEEAATKVQEKEPKTKSASPKEIVINILSTRTVNSIVKQIDIFSNSNNPLPPAYEYLNHFIKLKYESAILKKLQGLLKRINDRSHSLFPREPLHSNEKREAVALNEELVTQGDPDAIERKFFGLLCGLNGYTKNPEQAVALNEELVKQGDPKSPSKNFLNK